MEKKLQELLQKIEAKDAVVGVVGLGYVGLPVAVSFAEAGFSVIGVDVNPSKIEVLNSGQSFITDVPGERIKPLVDSGRFKAVATFETLSEADAILICVPTPITDGAPDLSLVVSAGKAIGEVLKSPSLVVLESTTYPGSTDELLAPLLAGERYQAGKDFCLAFSPERIDPGNAVYSFTDIPKIVGGIDDTSTEVAAALYGQVVPKVVTVTSTREAELAKLIENTFRHVNIALVNELAIYAHEMGIDIWEAIDAAASKPFGFMPFYPGPGWGGHCIPLDPAYLSWRVRRDRSHEVRFVEVAQAVNSEMPREVAARVSSYLNDQGKSVRNAKILAVGAAYKPGVDDTREAGALKVMGRLVKQGAEVSLLDPLVGKVEVDGQTLISIDPTPEAIASMDIVVILVAQHGIDWESIATNATFVLDCCNALKRKSDKIKRL